MTPPTAEEMERLRGLLAKATPGPWRTMTDGDGNSAIVQTAHLTRDVWQIPRCDEDLEIIVAAVNALPSLLAAAERLAKAERLIADYLGKMDYCLTAENLTLDDEDERDAAERRLRRFLAGRSETNGS